METCNPTTGCAAGTPLTCDDNNPCTADSCNQATGCVNDPTPLNGTACDDGSSCTNPDACTNGVCTGPAVVCPGDACNPPACVPATGCTNLPPPNCDDSNPCTTDSCAPATGCVHAPVSTGCCQGGVVCPAADQCTATSSCSTPNTPTTGTCAAGAALNCDDNNPCTTDSCDPASGCSHTPTTGGACDDSNACTTGDTCNNGTCTGTPLQCSDNNVCNGIETCDPATGCVAGTPPNCNNNDVCATNSCDPVLGCQNNTPPEAYAVCRLNVLIDAINGTPASELGGFKKKRKYMNLANGALKRLQTALAGSPHQRAISLRIAEQQLHRLNNSLQKAMAGKKVAESLGNELLDDVAKASIAIKALPSQTLRG
jgi:hypothetical protein